MLYQRRNFIKTTASALALMALSNKLSATDLLRGFDTGSTKLPRFGLQLYTLRDIMPSNPKGVLKQVAAMGYKQVESFEGDKGIYFGMTNLEFKKYLDDIGLTITSSHCDIDKNFEQKAGEAAAIGMKYLLSPYVGPQKSLDDYKKIADKFNERGAVCKKAGIRFAYHNHDYSFTELEGKFPQDIFMQNTDKDLVDFEMDIYWVVTAGQDPIKWLKKYPGRFRLSHIKDRKRNAPLTDKDASVNVGEGGINFKKILNAAKDNGVKYYIVEQEKYEHTTPLRAAKVDADYLKKFRF